jgi:hypothetical protein
LLALLTQAVFLLRPEDIRLNGILLLLWGLFTLTQLMKMTGKTNIKRQKNNLPGNLVAGLHRFLTSKTRKEIFILTNNLLFAFFIFGGLYLVLKTVSCLSDGYVGDCRALLPVVYAHCAISALAFWTAQIHSLKSSHAGFLMTYLSISSIFIFCYLLYTEETFLQADLLWIDVFYSVFLSAKTVLYFAGALCLGVYLYALKARHRNHGFALAATSLCIFLAVIDLFYHHNPAFLAVQFGCWTGMGTGWAQAWPSSKRNYAMDESRENFLTLEQM